MSRIKVPPYAKKAAREGLMERKKNKAGLTLNQARKEGVSSGVERAKQLERAKTISTKDAKAVGRFYDRFKNKRGERAETALKLWGGRRFARSMAARF